MKRRYPCPCCGFLTLTTEPPGSFELCPVCYWEDDSVQSMNPDYVGGANSESLNMAKRNFREIGASSPKALPHVRRPLPEEEP
jgi:hypothetical protein